MLAFDQVEKTYPDGTRVLNSVSFAVPAGQFCVLLGASGAGKSTLLRTVNGLVSPSAGRVCVDGVEVSAATLKTLRPRIGMIHQAFNLTPRTSAAVNVISGALPDIPAWRAALHLFPEHYVRRASALIEAVGLDEVHLARRVEGLSGGQQQRIGIARAFMLEPKLILADEPVASLDPKSSREVLELLKAQAGLSGAAVLCSLHQIDLARTDADRIVALSRGRIVFDGAPEALEPSILNDIYEQAATATAESARHGS